MKPKKILRFSIGLFILSTIIFLFTRCGPSKEEMEVQKKYPYLTSKEINILRNHEDCGEECDYIKELQNINLKINKANGEIIHKILENKYKNKKTNYYSALELELPVGKVVKFAPSTDEAIELNFEVGDRVYIHILQEDGSIKIVECNEKNWINLYAGDILN